MRTASRAGSQILWDRFGVPHIYAHSDTALFQAFGWAQARCHADLILRLYARSRGRLSELTGGGEEALAQDLQVHTLGIPALARRWASGQSLAFRACLEAFARGINAYARAHLDLIDPALRDVLPVSALDVIAHTLSVGVFTFAAWDMLSLAERQRPQPAPAGSNAWAVSATRAAGGHAILLANPHLPWSDKFLFTEAHLVGPGLDLSGVTLVGFPVITIGFNDRVAWTHTVNPILGASLYRITPDRAGYRLDGARRSFRSRRVRLGGRTHVLQETVHGPVVARDADHLYALRVAGLDRPRALEQWWAMGHATSITGFENALRRAQHPLMNVLYADADGHILYVDNGFIPVRDRGDWAYWSGVVPGDTTDTLWDACHPYAELPRLLDPPTGWLQNCNDPPWTCTHPPLLRPDAHPPYVAPVVSGLRPQRSIGLLASAGDLTPERVEELKHDTTSELARRVLDDLVSSARGIGGREARQAADVLGRWDRRTDASSRGAVLFRAWRREVPDGKLFARAWSPERPLDTPCGLADPMAAVEALERAAVATREAFGSLDVSWGEAIRLRLGGHDYPANGGPGDALGVFRTLDVDEDTDGKLRAVNGDTWVAVIEMGAPARARALLSYGNASQPGSPHVGDQLSYFSRKELRPVLRTRAEVEASLEDRESLP